MREIFSEIPVAVKNVISNYIDSVLSTYDLITATETIAKFSNNTPEEFQNFIDFYFHLQMEKMKNEDNND